MTTKLSFFHVRSIRSLLRRLRRYGYHLQKEMGKDQQEVLEAFEQGVQEGDVKKTTRAFKELKGEEDEELKKLAKAFKTGHIALYEEEQNLQDESQHTRKANLPPQAAQKVQATLQQLQKNDKKQMQAILEEGAAILHKGPAAAKVGLGTEREEQLAKGVAVFSARSLGAEEQEEDAMKDLNDAIDDVQIATQQGKEVNLSKLDKALKDFRTSHGQAMAEIRKLMRVIAALYYHVRKDLYKRDEKLLQKLQQEGFPQDDLENLKDLEQQEEKESQQYLKTVLAREKYLKREVKKAA